MEMVETGWKRIFDWRVRTWFFARLIAINTGMKDTELHDIAWRSACGMFNDCMAFCVNLHIAGGFLRRMMCRNVPLSLFFFGRGWDVPCALALHKHDQHCMIWFLKKIYIFFPYPLPPPNMLLENMYFQVTKTPLFVLCWLI